MSKIIRVKNISIGRGRPKICGLVVGETVEEVLEMVGMANEAACDMFELRIDFFNECDELEKVKSLLRKVKRAAEKPMIFTFRTAAEGGKRQVSEKYYKELLLMTAENALTDLVDVEAAIAENDGELIEKLKASGAVVILSKHDFTRTPGQEELIKIFLSMEKMGADIIKVAYMPNSKKDVLSLINATEEMTSSYASCPVVAISMGHLGMITRIMGEFLESAITFASITKASAPGQINVDGMENILDTIHNNYKKVFLAGFMGSGKTAVGNALSLNYGLNRIDLDAYIEQREQTSVADIIAESEELFHDKETKYLRMLLKKNYQVVSLGAGIMLRDENIQMMKEKGVIVFLKASPETVEKRIKNDKTRTILGENFDLEYIKKLMNEREARFMDIADEVIDTDDKNIDEICKEIVETLGFTL